MTASTANLRGNPRQGLWGATLGFFVGFASVALFGPTATRFGEALDLGPVMIGLLVAMPSLSGSLLRIPFSAWVDSAGARKPFLVLLVLSIAGMVGMLIATASLGHEYHGHFDAGTFIVLSVLGLLCGCGIATFSVGISQVSYWHPQARQGHALGIYAGVGNLAPGLFSLLMPLAFSRWGLSGSYLAWLLFLTAGTVVYAVLASNSWFFQLRARGLSPEAAREQARHYGQELFPARNLRESLLVSARNWRTWALVGIYFTTFGGFIALTSWFPTYWTRYFELSILMAGMLTAAYSLLASGIRVAGGWLADKAGGESTAVVSLMCMFVGAAMLIVTDAFSVAVLAVLLLAIGMGVTNGAVFKMVPSHVPNAVGGAAGWVGGLGAFGGFVIPPVLGWYVRFFHESHHPTAGYAWGFTVFATLAVLSFLLVGMIRWLPATREVTLQKRLPITDETVDEVSR